MQSTPTSPDPPDTIVAPPLTSSDLPPFSDLYSAYPSPTSTLPSRLNSHPVTRLVLANIFALSSGFALGILHHHKLSSLQFRAENAHRLPRTQKDWYFYHRSKNYYIMDRSLRGGIKNAFRIAGWASLFVVVENMVDNVRRRVDFVSTAVAGGITGAIFGVRSGLGIGMVGELCRKGLGYGIVYGVVQDAVQVVRGEDVWYLRWLVGDRRDNSRRRREEMEERKGSLQEVEVGS